MIARANRSCCVACCFTSDGERLVPSYTVKRARPTIYYSPSNTGASVRGPVSTARLPAVPIEELVTQQIVAVLSARTSCNRCGIGCGTSGLTVRAAGRAADAQSPACGGSYFQRSSADWRNC